MCSKTAALPSSLSNEKRGKHRFGVVYRADELVLLVEVLGEVHYLVGEEGEQGLPALPLATALESETPAIGGLDVSATYLFHHR